MKSYLFLIEQVYIYMFILYKKQGLVHREGVDLLIEKKVNKK